MKVAAKVLSMGCAHATGGVVTAWHGETGRIGKKGKRGGESLITTENRADGGRGRRRPTGAWLR